MLSSNDRDVVTVESTAMRFAQDVRVAAHHLRADEPVDAGGTDSGPSPYDYLLVALGACTSMTIKVYAERKSWPVTKVTVRLRHGKVHAADCEDCETRVGKIDRIEREIEIAGPLTPEQRARLLEIAERCPVHRTLTSEVKIVTMVTA
jgi:uncharacterized OsmC-like protein